MRKINLALIPIVLSLSACSVERFFYYPNRVLYNDPEHLHLNYELVHYPSLNGKILYGYLFYTKEKPLGTIVHFHGNYGNMTNHFPLALFLLKEGFDVLCFDYQGYGGSDGSPNRKKSIEDGIATVRFAHDHLRDKNTGVSILGQSLGGAIGIVVMAQEPEVRAAVVEAAFTSYRRMSKVVLQRQWFTYPFSWIFPPFLGKQYDPESYVAKISPRPILFIHGDADRIVPMEMSQQLYAAAQNPKKLWIIPGAGHLQCHRKAGLEYERVASDFFREGMMNSVGSDPHIDHKNDNNTSL